MAMAILLFFFPPHPSSNPTLLSPPHSRLPSSPSLILHLRRRRRRSYHPHSRKPRFFLTFAQSDSPGAIASEQQQLSVLPLLQEISDALVLPLDYLAKLPRDLRLDLNDAAFDLSKGPVLDECGPEVGEMLLNLSRAWEMADTATSNSIARELPSIQRFLTGSINIALGKRFVSAGRRFQGMGLYGEGELQRIAKALVDVGNKLSSISVIEANEESEKKERKLKFGEIEFEITPGKANVGAAVGFLFAVLAWQLGRGVESIPESSLQYANDNALILAKSLRGALLVLSYSTSLLSAFASVGLLLLARQLGDTAD